MATTSTALAGRRWQWHRLRAVLITPMQVRDAVVQGTYRCPPSRVIGLDEGLSAIVHDVRMLPMPAYMNYCVIDSATGFHECLGVVIQERKRVSAYTTPEIPACYEGIQQRLRHWKLDLAFLPINGRDAKRLKSGCIGNMTYQEAVDLAGSLQPGVTIPTHFEMFDGNTENPNFYGQFYIEVKYPGGKGSDPDSRCQDRGYGYRVAVAGGYGARQTIA